MNEFLIIDEAYLNELTTFASKKLVGKVLKRFELIGEQENLKQNIKELIYESWRDFKDLLEAHNKGLNVTQFHFKRKSTTPQE